MATTSPGDGAGSADPADPADAADLIVIGGGPAGCAAVLMAASVGLRSTLVEADALCGKLRRIPALGNVLGGFTSGPELAAAIARDVAATGSCRTELGVRAAEVHAGEDAVTVTLNTGRRLTAPYAVVATGVGPMPVRGARWLTLAPECATPAGLWDAQPPEKARSLLVLGADRPLGTFLRAHRDLDAAVVVAYPAEDDYKTDEVRADPRVTLLPVTALRLGLGPEGASYAAESTGRDGRASTRTADAVFLNLGSAPRPPRGDLVSDSLGYCPPGRQHPRLLTAGDLRSPRFQRIMSATGSGADAALRAYYALEDLPR